jgi:hypothetical protein
VCEGECEEDPTAAGGVGLDINRSFSKSSNVIALGVVFCCGLTNFNITPNQRVVLNGGKYLRRRKDI